MGRRGIDVYSDLCCLQRLQTNIHAKFEENGGKHTFTQSQLFSESFSEYSGYIMSLEDAIKLIKEYEVNTTTTFTVAYQTKGFGNSPIGKDFNCFSYFYKILLLITC